MPSLYFLVFSETTTKSNNSFAFTREQNQKTARATYSGNPLLRGEAEEKLVKAKSPKAKKKRKHGRKKDAKRYDAIKTYVKDISNLTNGPSVR